MPIDWNKLQEVYELAREKAVSFKMVYQESSDEFFFTVDSAAENENYIGRSYGFDSALAAVKDFLESL